MRRELVEHGGSAARNVGVFLKVDLGLPLSESDWVRLLCVSPAGGLSEERGFEGCDPFVELGLDAGGSEDAVVKEVLVNPVGKAEAILGVVSEFLVKAGGAVGEVFGRAVGGGVEEGAF